jgi:hypothetical protein
MSERRVILSTEDMQVIRDMVFNIHTSRNIDLATIWQGIMIFCESELNDPSDSPIDLLESPDVELILKEEERDDAN